MPAPNNVLKGQDIVWNDVEILGAFQYNPHTIRSVLKQMDLRQPTTTAIYQWVSRARIPDRWRPTLVYVLLRDQKITNAQLFKRGPKQ